MENNTLIEKIIDFFYTDFLGIAGIGCIGYGTSLYSKSLAFVVVGIIFLIIAILISKGKRK